MVFNILIETMNSTRLNNINLTSFPIPIYSVKAISFYLDFRINADDTYTIAEGLLEMR
jgi:hypothetical protein